MSEQEKGQRTRGERLAVHPDAGVPTCGADLLIGSGSAYSRMKIGPGELTNRDMVMMEATSYVERLDNICFESFLVGPDNRCLCLDGKPLMLLVSVYCGSEDTIFACDYNTRLRPHGHQRTILWTSWRVVIEAKDLAFGAVWLGDPLFAGPDHEPDPEIQENNDWLAGLARPVDLNRELIARCETLKIEPCREEGD